MNSIITDASGQEHAVVGVGDIELPTQTSPKKTGRSSHGVLRLKNVLHVPTIFCNIIGQPIETEYVQYELPMHVAGSFSGPVAYIANRSDGSIVAYSQTLVQGACLCEVQISPPPTGPKVGSSPFNSNGIHVIRAFWSNSEQERVGGLQASDRNKPIRSPLLTPGEKAYMNDFYRGEAYFLQMQGLSIEDEDDRDKGRQILRRFMADDGFVGYTSREGLK